jgi:hypothetical protein
MVVLYPTLHNVFNTDIAKEKSILMKNVFEFCLLLLFFSSCDKDNNNHTTQNGCDIKKIYSSSIHNSDGMTTIIENGNYMPISEMDRRTQFISSYRWRTESQFVYDLQGHFQGTCYTSRRGRLKDPADVNSYILVVPIANQLSHLAPLIVAYTHLVV